MKLQIFCRTSSDKPGLAELKIFKGFVSLKFAVSKHCKLLRSDCKHLSVETMITHLKLFIINGIISWYNANDANIRNVVFRDFKAVLRKSKYISSKVC